MGIGGVSIWQLIIVFTIILLFFGSKKLPQIGSDLGSALKGFKRAISDNPLSEDRLEGQQSRNQ